MNSQTYNARSCDVMLDLMVLRSHLTTYGETKNGTLLSN